MAGKKSRKSKELKREEEVKSEAITSVPLVSKKVLLLTGLMLALFAMLLYVPTYWYDFTYDDVAVVEMNSFVHKGFSGIKDILTNDYFKGFDPAIKNMVYRPVPLITFAIEHQFFGVNPHINHLGNIIFYGITIFFLFLTLQKLFKGRYLALSFMITLLFASHPIHVEVVANIKSRDELFAFMNFIISLFLLLQFLDSGRKFFFPLSLLFYFIALASKESMLTTLAVIPLALYFFRGYKISKITVVSSAYLALFLVFLGVRNSVLGGSYDPNVVNYLDNPLLGAKTFSQRWATNAVVLGLYFKNLVFPHPLASDYSYNAIPLVGWGSWKVWISLAVYGSLLFLAIKGFREKRLYAFGILFYFITLSIFSSVVVPNFNAYADRFLYTPALGFCMLAGAFFFVFIQEDERSVLAFVKKNIIPLSAFLVIVILYSAKTELRVPAWRNNWTLFTTDLKTVPNNSRMLKNYAGELVKKAMVETDARKKKDYAEEAVKEVKKALELYPTFISGYLHLGNAYFVLNDYANAEKAYLNALKISPKNYLARSNLANIYYRQGRYEDSMRMLQSIGEGHWSETDRSFYLKNKERIGR